MDELVEQVEALSVKPKMVSRETHLREWYAEVRDGVSPKDARGKGNAPRYNALMSLRKLEECPYKDDERELKEAWEAFKRNFPPQKESEAYYLEEFGRLYGQTQDFLTARGQATTYRFAALKNIVENDLEFPPELNEIKALLKSKWTYESCRFTEMTDNVHLHEFFEEYKVHNDFKKARGENMSARHAALLRITKKPDEECNEQEKRFKGLWEGSKTPEEHLEAFFEEYEVHNDFKKARGENGTARYQALFRITKKPDEECNELEKRLKELWNTHM